jgi:prephenate dehydrogenase
MKLETLAIVGVGLIGGSIGQAARERGVASHVIGIGRRLETLQDARALGAIDSYALDLARGVAGAELVVFATPVHMIARQVLEAAPACRAGTILTDAGSTKVRILQDLSGRLPQAVHFVGSHPLAGSEKRGPQHASAQLFVDRLTIVTPTPATQPEAVAKVTWFWQALGSRVQAMPAADHDRVLAFTSHLPHLVASALAGCLPGGLDPFTAAGFRDTTRVAAGDPALWASILSQNRESILAALDNLSGRLDRFRESLRENDVPRMEELLQEGKKNRDALDR